MWRWEKVGKEGGVETQRARTEEERERKERRLRAGSLEGTQAHALPGGDTDQFRHRCIHSSKHAHIGERNNHFCNIQYVQYVVHQPPTGGAFESVSFLSAWIDRYSTGGLRRGYLSEILIQITRSNTAMLLTESTMSSLHITIVMRSHLGISY
ncbi:putative beta-galactosidase B [Fusarium oxysporum f. sp. albedinis]|nr:putative beta-galactosidase B [Fusarium oxysporum f. sp. albedinis]